MKVCPWDKATPEVKALSVQTTVWSLELPPDGIIESIQLCDTAWTEEAEVFSHHWMNPVFNFCPSVISMTLGKYILRHKEEIKPMNPFFGVARVEFIKELDLSLLSKGESND